MSYGEEGPERSETPETATLAAGEERGAGGVAGSVFLPSEVIADRFRVVRLLGRGGMGEVYEVEDLELGERVAVKTLRSGLAVGDRALALFRSEIQLARRVTHPNVCRIFDVFRHARTVDGRTESVVFLTMELLAGETLSSRLRRGGPLPLAAALPILRQIAAGLDAAHDAGVAHHDLKSGNVILVDTPRGARAVVTDFGLAGAEEVAGAAASTFGTAPYRAPEQVRGGPAGAAADLYSFGVVMREVLTGAAGAGGAPTPAPAAETIARCLDARPEARPSSARSAYREIVAAAAQLSRGSRFAAALLTALLVAFALLGWRAAVALQHDVAADASRRRAATAEAGAAVAVATSAPPHRLLAVVGPEQVGWQGYALGALLAAELYGSEVEVLPPDAYHRLGHGASGRRGDWRSGLTAMGADLVVEVVRADPGFAATVSSFGVAEPADVAASDLAALAERLAELLRASNGEVGRPQPELRRTLVGDDPFAHELFGRALAAPPGAAFELLERAVARQPAAFRLQLERGRRLLAAGRLEAARVAGREARRLAGGLDEDRRLEADLLLAEVEGDGRLSVELLGRLAENHPERADYALERAEVLVDSGEPAAAHRELGRLLGRDPSLAGNPRYHHVLAGAWTAEDANEERLSAAGRSAALFERFGAREQEFEARFHEHEALRRLRRFSADAAVLDRAAKLAGELGDPRRAGHVERWRGVVAMVQGRGNQAERAFENALILAETTGDEDNLAWSSNNLAILRVWSGEFSAAAELYGAARRIHTASAFRLGVVMVDNNHSELLLWQGRLDEAGETARTVVEGARRLSNGTLQVSGLETLARVSLERGDLEGAERALDEALSTGRDDDVLALVYACSARVAMARGDLPRAQAWAQRALAATEGGGMPNERLTAVAMLGQTLGRAGRTLEARRFLQQALAIARDGDMRLHAATIVRHLGRLERRQGNVEAAERLLLAALAEHRRYGAELEAAHDMLELAELQLATGAGVAGEECARQALATYERLGAWAGAAAATDLLARGPSATGVAAGATLADAAPTGRPLW